ncbi:MAG: hypothetical protein RL367_111 [Pseudomonadota bacterium]|jgi:hypothetical protein
MNGETQSALTDRIEQALDRIEAALQSQQSRTAPGESRAAERHAALQTKTAAALRDLDALIASEEAR